MCIQDCCSLIPYPGALERSHLCYFADPDGLVPCHIPASNLPELSS